MSRFAIVYVDYRDGRIVCDPVDVQLYFLAEPDSLLWVINSRPPAAEGVEVAFRGEPPFTDFGMSLPGGGPARLVATGSRMKAGKFSYTLRFFDSEGNIVAETNPGILHDSRPPVWPAGSELTVSVEQEAD